MLRTGEKNVAWREIQSRRRDEEGCVFVCGLVKKWRIAACVAVWEWLSGRWGCNTVQEYSAKPQFIIRTRRVSVVSVELTWEREKKIQQTPSYHELKGLDLGLLVLGQLPHLCLYRLGHSDCCSRVVFIQLFISCLFKHKYTIVSLTLITCYYKQSPSASVSCSRGWRFHVAYRSETLLPSNA